MVSNAHYKLHVYSICGMSTALVITFCFVPSLERMTINRWPMERGCNSLAFFSGDNIPSVLYGFLPNEEGHALVGYSTSQMYMYIYMYIYICIYINIYVCICICICECTVYACNVHTVSTIYRNVL